MTNFAKVFLSGRRRKNQPLEDERFIMSPAVHHVGIEFLHF